MPQSPYIPGAYYRIKNLTQNSDFYLTAPGTGGGLVTFEKRRTEGEPDFELQLWYVMPLDNDRHLIANRASGLVLNVVGNSRSVNAQVEQFAIQPDTTASAQAWYMRLRADHISEASIVNAGSNLLLSPDLRSGYGFYAGKTPVLSAPYRADSYFSQVWGLETYSGYGEVGHYLRREAGDADDIPDITRLTGYSPPSRDRTAETLVGSVLIPFPFINDPVLTRPRQAQENPYYVLKRFGYWRNVYYYEHSGASSYTKSETVTVGLTTSNSKQVEHTAGVKVTAKTEFSFFGAASEISVEAEYQLKTSTTSTNTATNTTTTTIQRDYQAGKRRAEAIWYREDRFVLERLNGQKVVDWVIRNPDRMITDAYPA
ncbi:RICIN domain-containing protein [Streptomyces sp. NPDC057686]|uniref:RICIN domain-containing protein n=1 Tax=Streptomyces sp. NPDC057686 TaxID=3346212 RepID=UPI0036994376